MDLSAIYEAAARAGFLQRCQWQPADGTEIQSHWVGLQSMDETVLDHLAASSETTMSYPTGLFIGLAAHDQVAIDGMSYTVRDLRPSADGSEMRARLVRVLVAAS